MARFPPLSRVRSLNLFFFFLSGARLMLSDLFVYVRDKYRRSRYLSDLFYDIIHEGSLYKARFQEDKSRLISSTSAPSVNNVVFVVFYCCHCVVFSE